jgi:hypothetical protein
MIIFSITVSFYRSHSLKALINLSIQNSSSLALVSVKLCQDLVRVNLIRESDFFFAQNTQAD